MKVQARAFKSCMVALGVGTIVLMSASVTRAAEAESKVEITISEDETAL